MFGAIQVSEKCAQQATVLKAKIQHLVSHLKSIYRDQAIQLQELTAAMQSFTQAVEVVHYQQLVNKDDCSCSDKYMLRHYHIHQC